MSLKRRYYDERYKAKLYKKTIDAWKNVYDEVDLHSRDFCPFCEHVYNIDSYCLNCPIDKKLCTGFLQNNTIYNHILINRRNPKVMREYIEKGLVILRENYNYHTEMAELIYKKWKKKR